ncbi:MAG: hypothetical protein LKI67_06285 [Olsenella sp.]|nr:hypothetical protein [Olsenella sp.]MCI1645595.1 hypothetical protein [Olsenella sp.]MCI1811450.1 hypothetical protein [Olsenella sp.]
MLQDRTGEALPRSPLEEGLHTPPRKQRPNEMHLKQIACAMENLSEVQDSVRHTGGLTLADIESEALDLGRDCPPELLALSERIRQERGRLMGDLGEVYDLLGRQARMASGSDG